MIKYVETTGLILAWSFLLSIGWGFISYWLASARKGEHGNVSGQGVGVIPALVLGPLALVMAYRIFHINLIFPLHLFASVGELIVAAFFPALILSLACGLLTGTARNLAVDYGYWSRKRFVLVGQAIGKSQKRSLRRLVLTKSLTNAWSESLPWLFGELVVVEAIFNAPGLGLDAWTAAKMRDFSMLGNAIFWLAALYLACVFVNSLVSRWIGQKLESYA